MDRLEEIERDMDLIRSRLDELKDMAEPEGDEEVVRAALDERQGEVDELLDQWDELDEERKPLLAEREKQVARAQRLDAIRAAALNPNRVEPGASQTPYNGGAPNVNIRKDPFEEDPRRMGREETISRAMTLIDQEKRVPVTDDNKGHLEWLIKRSMDDDGDEGLFDGQYVAKRLLYTENPLYRSAFRKYVRFGPNAHLNAGESAAVARFQDYEIRRAASENVTSAGGFGIPVLIDPSIIITSGASDAPILRICRIEQVTNNIWKGVSSAGMSWSFDTEAAEVSDDAPTLAQPSVTVHMARGMVPYSIEVGQDYPGFAMEMGRLLDQGYTDLLATKTITGSGSGEPWGIFSALDQNTNVEVAVTTDGSFGGVDVFKVWNSLPERYRSRCTWVMSVHVESAIRQFAASAGSSSAYFTVDLTADGVSRINGRPVVVTDYAPTFASGVPGTTGAANILTVGDFSNYLIAQRAGMSVEQIPMLWGSSSRLPTGQRGIFAWARVGGDSINDLAFRLLQNQ